MRETPSGKQSRKAVELIMVALDLNAGVYLHDLRELHRIASHHTEDCNRKVPAGCNCGQLRARHFLDLLIKSEQCRVYRINQVTNRALALSAMPPQAVKSA